MHEDVNPTLFEGKTIARMDARAINIIRFFFTDGTSTAIEVEYFGAAGYGMVSCGECANYEPTDGDAPQASAHG